MTGDHPRRRRTDKPRRARLAMFLRENWYRDVWLVVISAILLWAAIEVTDTADQLVETRATAVRDACRADTVQADVLRSVLEASIAARKQQENAGRRHPDGLTSQDAVVLSDKLLRPLGGLRPSQDEKERICDRRVNRGTPTR